MRDIHSGFFLLVSLAAVVFVKATVVCPFTGDWSYHAHTGTCMSLQVNQRSFINANDECARFQGGSNNNIPGHLVYIFDSKTNEFVKGLLLGSSDKKALIGLNDRQWGGQYRWGDTTNSQRLGGYTEWADGQPSVNWNYRSVVITADGWKKYDSYGMSEFVCQVEPAVALPTIICPPAEVGKQSSKIICTMSSLTDMKISSTLSFKGAGQTVGNCSQSGCVYYKGYQTFTTVYAKTLMALLQIENVQRHHEGKWSCSVKIDGQEMTSKPCELKVYKPPKDPPMLSYLDAFKLVKLNSSLLVQENQTLTIVCQIGGGTPEVYTTTITCYTNHQRASPGNTTSITITATRDFHRMSCSCNGTHVTGWTKMTSVTFLVVSTPRITSFSINKYQVRKTENVSLTCVATGYPQYPLSLMHNQNLIREVNNSPATYRFKATCTSMGTYTCLAEKDAREQDVKYKQLKVICAPEHCPGSEQLPKFEAAVRIDKTVTMCVLVYPAPTSHELYKGETKPKVNSSRYRINFTYTDETTGRGEITLTLLSVSQLDFGVYKITSKFGNKDYVYPIVSLHFKLSPKGPPICPNNLTVSAYFADSITLSWKPGFDGGLQQSFTILRYDSGSTVESQPIPEPTGSLEDEISYNVTGLSESTTYTFGLRARNEEGVTECGLRIQGLTEASPLSGQRLTTIVLPIVLVLVLVIIVVVVVVVFVVVRRRRSRGVLKQDASQAPKAQASSSSRTDDHETSNANAKLEHRLAAQGIPKVNNFSKGASEEVSQDNAYALVVKENKKAQGESRDKNIFKRNSDELKQDNTYALVNKPDKGKGQGKSKVKNPSQEDTVEAQQDNTYAQVVKENKKKGKKQKHRENEENNGAVMYSNTSNYVTMNPGQAVDGGDGVYANLAGSSKARQEKPSPARDDGRAVTEDGLIYAEVMTKDKLTSPEIKGQARPKVAKLPPKVEEPGVEYMELDLIATARHK